MTTANLSMCERLKIPKWMDTLSNWPRMCWAIKMYTFFSHRPMHRILWTTKSMNLVSVYNIVYGCRVSIYVTFIYLQCNILCLHSIVWDCCVMNIVNVRYSLWYYCSDWCLGQHTHGHTKKDPELSGLEQWGDAGSIASWSAVESDNCNHKQ